MINKHGHSTKCLHQMNLFLEEQVNSLSTKYLMKPLFDDNNHISGQTTWSFVCLSTNNHLWTTRLALPFSISLWTKKSGMMLSRSSLGFVGTFGNNSVRTPNRFRCNRCKPSSEFVGVTLNPKKVQLVQGAFYPTTYPFPRLEPVVAIVSWVLRLVCTSNWRLFLETWR